MWSQRRELLGCRLVERKRLDLPVHGLPARGQGVDRRGLQPLLRPLGQADVTGLLEAAQELGESRVAPCVAAEVQPQAIAECITADVLDELLEDRGTLAVGDAIEDQEGDLRIRRPAGNGVRGRQLILLIGPTLDVGVEYLPRVRE